MFHSFRYYSVYRHIIKSNLYNVTYIVTVGTGKQLVAIYNVSFGRQILNWTVRDGHYIWRPTVSCLLRGGSFQTLTFGPMSLPNCILRFLSLYQFGWVTLLGALMRRRFPNTSA